MAAAAAADDLESLLRRARRNDPSQTRFVSRDRPMSDDEARELADALARNTSIRRLSLLGVAWGEGAMAALAASLAVNGSIEELDLSECAFPGGGLEALADGLGRNGSVRRLAITRSVDRLVEGDVKALADALAASGALEELDLSYNFFGNEGLMAISGGLRQSVGLRALDLSYNGVGMEGKDGSVCLSALSDALRRGGRVRSLNLAGNKIHRSEMMALGPLLRDGGCTVEELHLYNARIGADEEAERSSGGGSLTVLCDVLRSNRSIRVLNLSNNYMMYHEGVDDLASALGGHACLTKIDLSRNSIEPAGAAALADGLAGTGVREVCLSCNMIGSEGAKSIAKMMRRSTSITKLDVSSNGIDGEGTEALARALSEESSVLSRLDISGNTISVGGASALVGAVQAMSRRPSRERRGMRSVTEALGLDDLCDCVESLTGIRLSVPYGWHGETYLAEIVCRACILELCGAVATIPQCVIPSVVTWVEIKLGVDGIFMLFTSKPDLCQESVHCPDINNQ